MPVVDPKALGVLVVAVPNALGRLWPKRPPPV